MTPPAAPLSEPWRVGLRTAALAAIVLTAMQVSGAVEPVQLLAPGRDGQGGELMVADFGVEAIPDRIPFDGQYIYVTARLLPNLDEITRQIDESSYRLVRIIHPLLASPAPSGVSTALLLQAWNIVGVGLLAFGLADILSRQGHDPRWALWSTGPACLLPLILTTSEALAYGLGFLGLCAADRRHPGAAISLLAVAALTRESALTFALAAGLLIATDQRSPRRGVAIVAASALPVLAWWAYVQSISEASRIPLAPLGVVHLGDRWWPDVVASLVALVLIAISLVAWWDLPALRWTAIGFALWLPLYEEYAFKIVGLPRLSLPSIALGIAGLLRWRTGGRVPASAR